MYLVIITYANGAPTSYITTDSKKLAEYLVSSCVKGQSSGTIVITTHIS